MLEENVDLVAQHCGGFADRARRNFEHRGSLDAYCSHAPRFEIFFEMNHLAIAVKIDRINREAHGKRVNAMTGTDQEPATGRKARFVADHQSAKARPVRPRDDEIRSQIGRPCAVERLSFGDDHGI